MPKKQSILSVGVIALVALAAGYLVQRQLTVKPPVALQSGTAIPTPRPLAPFSLTDHVGAAFTNATLVGKPHLVFFGFTHCPDICPATLALLAQLSRDPATDAVATVFVTVDPERDDQTVLQRYVDAFGGRFIGVRGEQPALDPLLQSLGAASRVQKTPDGGYLVDHTATLFYLDAEGRLAAVFTPPFSLPALRADLAALGG